MTCNWKAMVGLRKGWLTFSLLLFASALVIQPLIATKVLKPDAQGRYVLVCTLNGLQALSVQGSAVNEESSTSAASVQYDCPACLLNSILASSTHDGGNVFGATPDLHYQDIRPAEQGYSHRSIFAPTMRAPPQYLS
ncbi:hypothetical protein BGP75_08515 [Motiliproteus sp. MSK22-1]|nr:hypothetical protein BGP75_08515 [Motiliproteus sp. MSK22-1]